MDIFDTEPIRLARTTDPETSKLAAVEAAESAAELQQWAADCVAESPGCTQRELGMRYCSTDPRKIGRRLNECDRRGMVRRGPKRACKVSGRQAETWWPIGHRVEEC